MNVDSLGTRATIHFRNTDADSYAELREEIISLAKDESLVEVFGDEGCAEAVHEHLVVLQHDVLHHGRIVDKHHLLFTWETTPP